MGCTYAPKVARRTTAMQTLCLCLTARTSTDSRWKDVGLEALERRLGSSPSETDNAQALPPSFRWRAFCCPA
ncbi:hypothetical protein GCM10027162_55130 [Streptomyces incanus]